MQKSLKKSLAFLLVLTMFFTSIPVVARAEEKVPSSNATAQTEPEEAYVVSEIVEKREPNMKYFRMSDGSITAAVYQYDVHYDENGTLVDIDNTFSEGTDESEAVYQNEKNETRVKFMKKSNKNKLYTITKGDYKVKVSIEGVSKVEGVIPKIVDEELGNELFRLEGINSKITYPNIFENVDIQYYFVSKELKENIILKQPVDFSKLTYHYDFGNQLEAIQQDERTILVKEKESERVTFEISAPAMWDAKANYFDGLQITLKEFKNGKATIELSWNEEAIKDATYPVTIDPVNSFSVISSEINDTHILAGYPSKAYNAENHIRVRNNGYALLQFPTPTLNSGDRIVHAELCLFPYGYFDDSLSIYTNENSFNPPLYINIHRILRSWSNTNATYNNVNPDNNFYDSTVEAQRIVDGDDHFYYWNITRLANEWVEGHTENYGVLLKYDQPPSNGTMFDSFFCSTNGTYIPSSAWPQIIYQYINTSGVEDYFAYHTQELGKAGTGYVNDLTGNLTIVTPLFNVGLNLVPINVSLVYNSNNVNKSVLPYGRGWQLNWSQKIDRTIANDFGYDIACYTDGDGTEHYFRYEEDVGKYVDEKDSKRTIVQVDSNNYKLDDGSGSYLHFKRNNTTNTWYLWKYEDAYGNYIEVDVNWSQANRIDKLTSSTGNEINFLYNQNNYLTAIQYYDGDVTKSISIEYNNYVTQANNCIGKITFPDNTSIQYHYNESLSQPYYISKVVDIDGMSIGYGYTTSTPYRVNDMKEYGTQGEVGNQVGISYHSSGTVFTDISNNRQYLHTFAANGTKKSVVDVTANDGNGYGQYYEYNNGNANILEGMGNLTFVSKVQKSTVNLIRNHSFENSVQLPVLQVWEETSGTSTGGITTSKSHIGQCSYRLTRPTDSNSTRTAACYSVDVIAGKTYTLSAYVNTADMISLEKGASLYVALTDAQYESECVTQTSNEWKRISLSFTPTQSETANIYLSLTGATGSVYFDNVQLEEGGISNYNLLENAGFESDNVAGLNGWQCQNQSVNYVTTEKCSGNRSAKITGGPNAQRHYMQEIQTPNGKAGDTYVASAFAKAESVYAEEKMFTILVRFLNGTTCVNEVPLLFNWNTTQWQKVAGAAKATGDYASVQFVICYYNNNNSAYFDNAQLIKDTFGSTYTYDSDGNLISTVDLQGKEEYTFQYDGNNQLIKETSVSGGEINYTYTDKKSLASVSAGGVKTEYTYDSRGNVTETDTYNKEGDALHMGVTAVYSENGDYPIKIIDSRNQSTYYEFHPQREFLISETDARFVITGYEYNNSQLIETMWVGYSKTDNGQVHYYYTNGQKLQTIISPSGTTYQFTYDNFGRKNSTKVENRLLSNHEYTNEGLLASSTYGNGATIDYTYDELNREEETWINNVLRYKKSYDGDSRVSEIMDVLGAQKYKYEYDILGRYIGERFITETTQNGYITETTQAQLRIRYDDTKNRVVGYDSDIQGNTNSTEYVYGEISKAPDIVNGVKHNGTRVLSYHYDELNRLQSRTLHTSTPVVTEYEYLQGAKAESTTTLVKKVQKGNDAFEYSYDGVGNITQIVKNGELVAIYSYDAYNQIEVIIADGDAYEYSYNSLGNVGTVRFAGQTIKTYTYGDNEWKDLLTAYNNQTITYDTIGNPLAYINGRNFTWTDGRKLATVSQGNNNIAYTYNVNGLRNSKTVNNTTTTYYWLDGSLEGQKTGEEYIFFLYDEAGTIYGFVVKNDSEETTYYYDFNLQGDVVGIVDTQGNKVVEYSYDVWGMPLTVTGTLADTIGQKNPIRYRGYYYDVETGFYYLNSRYYDPEIGRFINADSQLNTSLGVLGLNQFSYCLNNPIGMVDYGGNKPGDLSDTPDEAARDFAEYINEKSIKLDCEYGSYIYKKTVWETKTITYYNPNLFGDNFLSSIWNYAFHGGPTKTVSKRVKVTKYSYVAPKKGTKDSVSIPINWFGAKKKVAEIHTHAAYDPKYLNDIFSPNDLNKWTNYLVTPLGTVRKYNPVDGSDIIIYNDVPYDPNHPGRK